MNVVAAVGLALSAVFGLAGTIVTESNLRNISWGIDSLGLMMATAKQWADSQTWIVDKAFRPTTPPENIVLEAIIHRG